MKQIIRHGAYGVLLQDSHILLTQKKSGPYKELWGLSGGAIEFGETPEEALRREFLEETAIAIGAVEFLHVATATGYYENEEGRYGFHQTGILYTIIDWEQRREVIPEEECFWISLSEGAREKITPFALQAITVL